MGQAVIGSNNLTTNFQQTISYGIGPLTQTLPGSISLRSIFQTSGTLADQCNLIYEGTIALAASTPQSLNLQSGLTDLAGLALVFGRVRFLLIRNKATTDTWVLTVGNSGANDFVGLVPATGTFLVYPSTANNDGFAMWQAPGTTGAVVDATHKIIKLDPGAHAMSVDILIAGTD